MARPAKPLPPELIADWEAGALSPQALAAKHGVPRKTITDRLKDVPRDPAGARRAGVRAGVSGLQDIEGQAERAGEILREEVGRDVAALSLAARNALAILQQVAAATKASGHAPRALLQLAQANSAALESWRRARELDEPEKTAPPAIQVEFVGARSAT